MLALFQIAVMVTVFAVIYPSNKDLGLAVAAVSFLVAFIVTGLVARLVDTIRFSRRSSHSRQPDSHSTGLTRIDWHSSDSPQIPYSRRIGQDRRDTIEI